MFMVTVMALLHLILPFGILRLPMMRIFHAITPLLILWLMTIGIHGIILTLIFNSRLIS